MLCREPSSEPRSNPIEDVDRLAAATSGENPLYLPQAKIFRHSCAIGPTVLLVDPADAEAPRPRAISLRISRGGAQVFEGSTATDALKRSYRELVSYLCRDNEVWPGTVLRNPARAISAG